MSGTRLGVVCAMPEELRELLAGLSDVRSLRRAGRDLHYGRWGERDVVLALSGIGKVAAATTAALLLGDYQVDALIFTGVAGGLDAAVRVGDVVVATELLQHDMDASPLFPRYEVPLSGRSRFPCDMRLSDALARAVPGALAHCAAALAAFGASAPALHRGLIVSGDRFVSSAAESAELRGRLPDALAVEMEGAAAAQVCADFGVPFAVMRVVSDRADDQAHVDFPRFVAGVASVVAHAVLSRAASYL